jgi:ribosomal-protein-alanine N-acetyltransferase
MAIKVETIDTPRLSLTLVTANDHEFIFRLVNSKDWLAFIGDRNVSSPEQARLYIERILKMDNFFYWVIRTCDTQIPIGIVSFLKRDYLPHFDIGFALLPEHYKKGYAFEATSAVLSEYSSQGHHHILATVQPDNKKSISLLGKLGFAFERSLHQNSTELKIFTWTNVKLV